MLHSRFPGLYKQFVHCVTSGCHTPLTTLHVMTDQTQGTENSCSVRLYDSITGAAAPTELPGGAGGQGVSSHLAVAAEDNQPG